ncbi:hypothetical protein HK097_005154, partial [Rhizophlyctis rosea]
MVAHLLRPSDSSSRRASVSSSSIGRPDNNNGHRRRASFADAYTHLTRAPNADFHLNRPAWLEESAYPLPPDERRATRARLADALKAGKCPKRDVRKKKGILEERRASTVEEGSMRSMSTSSMRYRSAPDLSTSYQYDASTASLEYIQLADLNPPPHRTSTSSPSSSSSAAASTSTTPPSTSPAKQHTPQYQKHLSVIASHAGWDDKIRELVLKEAHIDPTPSSPLALPTNSKHFPFLEERRRALRREGSGSGDERVNFGKGRTLSGSRSSWASKMADEVMEYYAESSRFSSVRLKRDSPPGTAPSVVRDVSPVNSVHRVVKVSPPRSVDGDRRLSVGEYSAISTGFEAGLRDIVLEATLSRSRSGELRVGRGELDEKRRLRKVRSFAEGLREVGRGASLEKGRSVSRSAPALVE